VALAFEEVVKLADLARIDMTDEELTSLASQLDVILDAVAVVSQVAGDDVVPTSHALDITNVFRADEVAASLSVEQVLAMAPDAEDGRIRVPRILGEAS
jgi:aspartyl-tRNA(Asn)/glutamyl-tRNA(Gln) amidotransferase subunit C